MTFDKAEELQPHGVAALCLYPGLVRTEAVMAAAPAGWLELSNSQSPEFAGSVGIPTWWSGPARSSLWHRLRLNMELRILTVGNQSR